MRNIFLFTLASAAPLMAAPDGLRERFNQFDTSKDGVISGEEMQANPILSSLDLDGNGTLTPQEALRALRQMRRGEGSVAKVSPSAVPIQEDKTLKEQPQLLKPAEHGIGHRVPDVSVQSINGETVSLSELGSDKNLVLICFSSTCPICNKLGPEIARIEKSYAEKDVSVYLLNTVPEDSAEDVSHFISTHGLQSPVLNDAPKALLGALNAQTTTEVFVIDKAQTLVYRGALNDQYGLGYSKEKPGQNYLRWALDSLLAGEQPTITATTAPGCALDLKTPETPVAKTAVTYHNQIARIMQNNCVDCHRDGGVGPFSLATMADVTKNAGMIRKQVERGVMPPWFAVHADKAEPPFSNDRSLTEQDKTDLLTWLASERPAGDPAHAPVARRYVDAWTIGKPDAILQIPKAFAIKAEGIMPYQHAVVYTDFPEDRWVSAYEILPTNASVVHHVIVRVHPKGSKITDHEEGSSGFWAAYVPGNASRILPEGFAKKLPAGSRLSFQIHYTPNGKATQDQLRIALKFADTPPMYEVDVASVAQHKLSIPPHAASHVITKRQPVPFDMMFTGFMPHMHVRGAAFKYEMTYPDQTQEVLLDIPEYDFNWQLQYNYKQPKFIPKGSVLTITAIFDNSAANPANPDPSKTVRWGAQTYDEMMIGYVEHYRPLPPGTTMVK